MSTKTAMVPLKPRVSGCGSHWQAEWNRFGNFYPQHVCRTSWRECIEIALRIMREGKTAQVEQGSYLDPAVQADLRRNKAEVK